MSSKSLVEISVRHDETLSVNMDMAALAGYTYARRLEPEANDALCLRRWRKRLTSDFQLALAHPIGCLPGHLP